MDYEQPFVAEIRSHPYDDTPRLIYADFLDEAGDPQGELIRLQVALSHLAPGEAERRDLELRESELLSAYADDWLAPLRALGAEGVSARSFQRGLIEKVTLRAAKIAALDELCRLAPALCSLQLIQAKARFARVATLQLPAQITGVDLRANQLGTDEIDALVQGTWPMTVKDLDLQFNGLDQSGLSRLTAVAWPQLVCRLATVSASEPGGQPAQQAGAIRVFIGLGPTAPGAAVARRQSNW
jgi:uncharacterized protein (TIGR02996 family)